MPNENEFKVTLVETITTIKDVNVLAENGVTAASIALQWANGGKISFEDNGIVEYKVEDVRLKKKKKK
jgi:hypothetical protein